MRPPQFWLSTTHAPIAVGCPQPLPRERECVKPVTSRLSETLRSEPTNLVPEILEGWREFPAALLRQTDRRFSRESICTKTRDKPGDTTMVGRVTACPSAHYGSARKVDESVSADLTARRRQPRCGVKQASDRFEQSTVCNLGGSKEVIESWGREYLESLLSKLGFERRG